MKEGAREKGREFGTKAAWGPRLAAARDCLAGGALRQAGGAAPAGPQHTGVGARTTAVL